MRVRVLSFGPLKPLFAEGGEWRALDPGASVGQLLAALQDEGRIPPAALHSAAIAINEEYAALDCVLHDGDEVAILPPVSGGATAVDAAADAEAAAEVVQLIRDPIDTTAILATIKAGPDGAVCIFDGIVRDNTRGRTTLHLDYEAYDAMALRQMQLLRDEALQQYAVREVVIVHRLGRLYVGETSVLIAVASAHRGAAFDACRWVIDTLKKTVPIWKREQFADGAVWADGEPFPEEIAGPRQ